MEEPSPRFPIARTTAEAMPADIRARIVDANGNELCSAPAKCNPAGSTDNCRMELAPSQILSGFYPPDSLVQDLKNFKKSSAPSRFLSFRDGSWTDFSPQVFDALSAGFLAGKTALDVTVGGDSYLFDFLRMSQINQSTGARSSIGWMDVDGKCFFPGLAVDEQGSAACPKLGIEIRIDKISSAVSSESGSLKRKRDQSCSLEEHSDESPGSPPRAGSRWPGAKILKEEDRFYQVVEKLFLYGIRRFAPDTVITSIFRYSPSGLSGDSRLKAFQMQLQMTKAARGDANVKFGWYGAPAEEIARVMAHGFGWPNNKILGPHAHGVGIHLSPPHFPHTSAVLSTADLHGMSHVILCRVIMGNPEKVPEGSRQFHPSSDQFDSGVDDLVNPRWYTTWSTRMNTHIHPEYVVSFKASKQPHGTKPLSPATKPLVRGPPIIQLITELGKSIPSTRKQALEILCHQHKEGKISKEIFITHIRSLVTDQVLSSAMKKIRRPDET